MGQSLYDYCVEHNMEHLLGQWQTEKNVPLTAVSVSWGSKRRVWWRCEKGHEWQAEVSSRTGSGAGCPVCAGKKIIPGENDFAGHFPELAAQWNKERNGELTPEKVTPYSNRRVWWTCPLGHEYLATVAARTAHGSNCPYCTGRKVLPGFNDLATLEPKVAVQWHPTLNGELTPEMVTLGSHKKIWWQCQEGHVWKAVVHSRAGPKKCGCPVCAGKASSKKQDLYRSIVSEAKTNAVRAEMK